MARSVASAESTNFRDYYLTARKATARSSNAHGTRSVGLNAVTRYLYQAIR
jgi:hypothetical protein